MAFKINRIIAWVLLAALVYGLCQTLPSPRLAAEFWAFDDHCDLFAAPAGRPPGDGADP